MSNLRALLAERILKAAPKEGFNKTYIPRVYCLKFSKSDMWSKSRWMRSLLIVAQGQKEIALENKSLNCREPYYIAAPIDLPVSSRIRMATQKNPYLGLLIEFDLTEILDVASKIKFNHLAKVQMRSHAIFAGPADDKILESAIRLTDLFMQPDDVPTLAPLLIKEIFYYLMKGPNGKAIYEFAKAGSKFQKISESIQNMRSDLISRVDVVRLAEEAHMSRATFFKFFKEATAMSPIQYQKRLRLIEAKRLLIDEFETAEGAAFKVGYKSASQFSREYSRMFGKAPLKDVAELSSRSRKLPE